MANRRYPITRFEITTQSQNNEIAKSSVNGSIPIIMATYTSSKGSENWELITGLESFTKSKGGLNFTKHGQAQLLVATALTNGAYVLGKRMVSDDATLANATVKAKVIRVDDINYVYYHIVYGTDVKNFKAACDAGYNNFDSDAEPTEETTDSGDSYTSIDIPLFTVAAVGRCASSISFRLVPDYYMSKSGRYTRYNFEVIENAELIGSVGCAYNPDIIMDNVSQTIQNKVNTHSVLSKQIKVRIYEDAIYKLTSLLAETAILEDEKIGITDLINMDYINAKDIKGVNDIAGIVVNGDEGSLWASYTPKDITPVFLEAAVGIPLLGGSYGESGNAPVQNAEAYEKMLLGAYGANMESTQFDPVIYDTDNYKVDAIFDCGFPMSVKNAIVNLCDIRGDIEFFSDLGMKYSTLNEICSAANEIAYSKNVAVYHNFFNIINPFDKKEITVTMPYLICGKLIKHISSGVGRPFAGIANNLTFPEIIDGTVNFLPFKIPGLDQKQLLVDSGVNYISYYDGIGVMDTMFTHMETDEDSGFNYVHNVMGVQEIIKLIRSKCPANRYTFLDGRDLELYIEDIESAIKEFNTYFSSIGVKYMYDPEYEGNNVFFAALAVKFRPFAQEELFRITTIES